MNRIWLHTDNYTQSFTFNTTTELLEHKFVNHFINDDFYGYRIHNNTLIAVYDDGFLWYIVGIIHDISTIDIPKWTGGRYLVKDSNGDDKIIEVNGNDIKTIKYGTNTVYMKDGNEYTLTTDVSNIVYN